MVRKDAWNDFDFFEFIKFRFMAQDVIYPGEGSIFLSGKSCGQRSLVGYSPWGCKRVEHVLATKQQQQLLNWYKSKEK